MLLLVSADDVREVVSEELLGYVVLVLAVSDGVVLELLAPGEVDMPYVEPVALEVEVLASVELVVSVELELELGLVAAVVFKLPLVFSFVVLGLDLELVLPSVESEDVDGYVESVVDEVESLVLIDGEL